MRRLKIVNLIVCIAIPLIVGGIAGVATSSNITTWYVHLNKPAFNPPNSIFGPVWTVLYLLMGISLYLIWRAPKTNARTKALRIFGIQLALNFAWSFLFFYFHLTFFAFVEIILIWIAIALMIYTFRRVNKAAAYLQIPYLLWVSFASVLNAAIWMLN
jgi:tryptophan-rich sensory protein